VSILRALLDATPLPPEDADVDMLTERFAVISADRQVLIESIAPPLAAMSPEDRAVFDELRARQEAWMAALSKALDHVRAQRIGTAKLKGYAAGVG
jgi:hypothetical protein